MMSAPQPLIPKSHLSSLRTVLRLGIEEPSGNSTTPTLEHFSLQQTLRFVALRLEPKDKLGVELNALVGPYDVIAIEEALYSALTKLSEGLPALLTHLVKLSHWATTLTVEPQHAMHENAEFDEFARTFAVELSRETARRSNHRYSRKPEDHLRKRWQAQANQRASKAVSSGISVAVLGAGISGTTIGLELARRGYAVTLIDAHDEPLRGASNQPLLACHPQFSLDHNSQSQLSQLALLLALGGPYRDLFARHGRYVPAQSLTQAMELRNLAARNKGPIALAFLEPNQVAHMPDFGNFGGLWIADAATISTPLIRKLILDTPPLHLLIGYACTGVRSGPDGWQLDLHATNTSKSDKSNPSKNQVKVVGVDYLVIASGSSTPALLAKLPELQRPELRLAGWQDTGGRSFVMPSFDQPYAFQSASIGGPASLHLLNDGNWLLGSTYFPARAEPPLKFQKEFLIDKIRTVPGLENFDRQDSVVRHSNLLEQLAPQPKAEPRCNVVDRMPLVGPLQIGDSQAPKAYLACAFGSRGLLWSHLAARLIADHLDGVPPIIGLKALKSIDPFRFQSSFQSSSV